jgi:hypothetical protein
MKGAEGACLFDLIGVERGGDLCSPLLDGCLPVFFVHHNVDH